MDHRKLRRKKKSSALSGDAALHPAALAGERGGPVVTVVGSNGCQAQSLSAEGPSKAKKEEATTDKVAGGGESSSSSRQRPNTTSSVPCRFFQRGHCRYGDSCRFQHSAADAPTSVAAGPSNPAAKASSKGKASGCLDWLLTGSCKRGSKCRYAHPQNPVKESEGLNHLTGNRLGGFEYMTAQLLARLQGGCTLGSSRGDDDEMVQRMRNCGFTDDDVYELSLQGIKPWDPEAWDALAVLNGWDMNSEGGYDDVDDDEDEMEQRMMNGGFTDSDVYELSLQGIKPWDPEARDALDVLNGQDL